MNDHTAPAGPRDSASGASRETPDRVEAPPSPPRSGLDGAAPANPGGEAGKAGAALTITIYGRPITQGSKTRTRYGMRDDNTVTLKPWREAVKTAAMEAAAAVGWPRVDGPLAYAATYTFDKPTSAPKRRRSWPTTRATGDGDKLQRACWDALTDAGVWMDDARVVGWAGSKVYVGDPGSLPIPGAVIRIWPVGGAQ